MFWVHGRSWFTVKCLGEFVVVVKRADYPGKKIMNISAFILDFTGCFNGFSGVLLPCNKRNDTL